MGCNFSLYSTFSFSMPRGFIISSCVSPSLLHSLPHFASLFSNFYCNSTSFVVFCRFLISFCRSGPSQSLWWFLLLVDLLLFYFLDSRSIKSWSIRCFLFVLSFIIPSLFVRLWPYTRNRRPILSFDPTPLPYTTPCVFFQSHQNSSHSIPSPHLLSTFHLNPAFRRGRFVHTEDDDRHRGHDDWQKATCSGSDIAYPTRFGSFAGYWAYGVRRRSQWTRFK